MQGRKRGEAAAGSARATVARAGGCSDGGSGREQGLRCWALVGREKRNEIVWPSPLFK